MTTAVAIRPTTIPCVNTAHTAIKPGHTLSLLELMPAPKFTAEAWQRYCQSFVKESQERRKGVKATHEAIPVEQADKPPSYWEKFLQQQPKAAS